MVLEDCRKKEDTVFLKNFMKMENEKNKKIFKKIEASYTVKGEIKKGKGNFMIV